MSMDLVEATPDDKAMDNTADEVLVVLQTENGEEIALPMSALPKDFIPENTTNQETQERPPRIKQKRKEPLLTRPLSEEDLELQFQIIEEPSPPVQESEVKRKPRKEYRTKKRVRMALERLSKEVREPAPKEISSEPESPNLNQSTPTERRTRLSNTCRVATGKSYKCNDCEFSTDRINNIIIHIKESCPRLRKV